MKEEPVSLSDFLSGTEKIAIHCKTQEQAKELLSLLQERGFKWTTGETLGIETFWSFYDKITCYDVYGGNVSFAWKDFYNDFRYKIVDFEDVFDRKKEVLKNE